MSTFRNLLSMPNRHTESLLFPVQLKRTSDGTLERVLITPSVRLPVVTSIGENTFRSIFKGMNSLEWFSMPDLVTVGDKAFQDTFANTKNILGFQLPKVTTIDAYRAFFQGFAGADLTSLTTGFPFAAYTNIHGQYNFYGCFENAKLPSSWLDSNGYLSFPNLTVIGREDGNSNYCFSRCFNGTKTKNGNTETNLTKILFPELTYLKAGHGFLDGLNSGSTISFPKLTTLIGASIFNNISTVLCPELVNVTGWDNAADVTNYQFENVTTINFPKATSLTGHCFKGCGTLTFNKVTELNYSSEIFYGGMEDTSDATTLNLKQLHTIHGVEKNSNTVKGIFSGNYTDIYFNKLENIPDTYLFTCTYSGNTLNPSCTVTNLHFAQVHKAKIMATKGWNVRWGLGEHANVMFDRIPDSDEVYKFTVTFKGGNKGTITTKKIPYGKTVRETLSASELNIIQTQDNLTFKSWDKSLDEPIFEDTIYTASYECTVKISTTDASIYYIETYETEGWMETREIWSEAVTEIQEVWNPDYEGYVQIEVVVQEPELIDTEEVWRPGQIKTTRKILKNNPITYTVSWNTNINVPTLYKEGYDFKRFLLGSETFSVTTPIKRSANIVPEFVIKQVELQFNFAGTVYRIYDGNEPFTFDYGTSFNSKFESVDTSNFKWKSGDTEYAFSSLENEIYHRLGYTFVGWSDRNDISTEDLFDHTVTEEVTTYDEENGETTEYITTEVKGLAYNFDSVVTVTTKTIYAYFNEIRYTIRFDVRPDEDSSPNKYQNVSVLEGTQFGNVSHPTPVFDGTSFRDVWYYENTDGTYTEMKSTDMILRTLNLEPAYVGAQIEIDFIDYNRNYDGSTNSTTGVDFHRTYNRGDKRETLILLDNNESFTPNSRKIFKDSYFDNTSKLNTVAEVGTGNGSYFLGWTEGNYNYSNLFGKKYWYKDLQPSISEIENDIYDSFNYVTMRRTNLKSAIKKFCFEDFRSQNSNLSDDSTYNAFITYIDTRKELQANVASDTFTDATTKTKDQTLQNYVTNYCNIKSLKKDILGTPIVVTNDDTYTYQSTEDDHGFIVRYSESVSDNGTIIHGAALNVGTDTITYIDSGILFNQIFSFVIWEMETESYDEGGISETVQNNITEQIDVFRTYYNAINNVFNSFAIYNYTDTSASNNVKAKLISAISDVLTSGYKNGIVNQIRTKVNGNVNLTNYINTLGYVNPYYNAVSTINGVLNQEEINTLSESYNGITSTVESLYAESIGYVTDDRVYPIIAESNKKYIDYTLTYNDTAYTNIAEHISNKDTRLLDYINMYLGYKDNAYDYKGNVTTVLVSDALIDPKNIKKTKLDSNGNVTSYVLYGSWADLSIRLKKYTITWTSKEHNGVLTDVVYNTTLNSEPADEHYNITSWDYVNEDGNNAKFKFGQTKVRGSWTLTAVTEPKLYTVTYHYPQTGETSNTTVRYESLLVPEYTIGQTGTNKNTNTTYARHTEITKGVFIGYTRNNSTNLYNNVKGVGITGCEWKNNNTTLTWKYGKQPSKNTLSSAVLGRVGTSVINFNLPFIVQNFGDMMSDAYGYWIPIKVEPEMVSVEYYDSVTNTLVATEQVEYDTVISEYTPSGYYRNGDWKDESNVVLQSITNNSDTVLESLKLYAPLMSDISVPENTTLYNVNMYEYAQENGWNGQTALHMTIPSTSKIGSVSPDEPAFVVAGNYPNNVTLVNNGSIIGAGGKGGSYLDGVGGAGGTALKVESNISITNNGTIAGGGGGGGAGAPIKYNTQIYNENMEWIKTYFYNAYGSAGGGGAGIVSGFGGTSIGETVFDPTLTDGNINLVLSGNVGQHGTETLGGEGGAETTYEFSEGIPRYVYTTIGGKGGDLGESGESGQDGFVGWEDIDATEYKDVVYGYAGGTAGAYVEGNNKVTWTEQGTVKGIKIS